MTTNNKEKDMTTTDDTVTTEPGEVADAAPAEGGNREAAGYRRRLREVEAERDSLAGHLEALRTAEVHRLAGAVLADPADLFGVGNVTLTEVLDEAGRVDPARVEAKVAEVLATRPRLARDWTPLPPMDPGQGAGRSSSTPPASFADAFKGGRRR